MLAPASTGEGEPELVTLRLTTAFTSVLTVVELLAATGSLALATDEFAVMVDPSASVAFTFTVTSMFATEPAASVRLVQVTVPPAEPTTGVTQVQPAGARMDW